VLEVGGVVAAAGAELEQRPRLAVDDRVDLPE
jgi:hypothetical protein